MEAASRMGAFKRQIQQGGFTYVFVLLVVALTSVGLSVVGTLWSANAQRERSIQAQWAAEQYRAALDAYWRASPGVLVRVGPPAPDALLLDPRYIQPVRRLRRLYANPLRKDGQWSWITTDGSGIQGIEWSDDHGVVHGRLCISQAVSVPPEANSAGARVCKELKPSQRIWWP